MCYLRQVLFSFCIALQCPAFSQTVSEIRKHELSVTAGVSATFLKDIDHWVLGVPDGALLPGVYEPYNSTEPPLISITRSSVKLLPSWFGEVKWNHSIGKGFALSMAVGVENLRFDYETVLKNFTHPDYVDGMLLDEFDATFGRTSLTYFTFSPLNLSKAFFNRRLTLEVGPTVDFLLDKKLHNVLLVYESEQSRAQNRPDKMFFDSLGRPKKQFFTLDAEARTKVAKRVSVAATMKVATTSLYEEVGYYSSPVSSIKPVVGQLAVSYSLW
jgi:hypothetical protein